MIEKRKICCLAVLATLFIGFSSPSALEKAYAAEKQYTVEYTEKGITLPLLHLEKGQSYQVEVFAVSDTEYKSPLKKADAYTFIAPEIGEFRLRYLINDNGVERYEYATLTITDTTKPVIAFNHQSVYKTGETLALVPSITDNTASMAKVEYQLVINGKSATSQIQGNKITFTQAGEYKLQIAVTDGGGNTTKEVYSFTVEQGESGNSNSPRGGCKGSTGAETALTFGVLAVATLLRKKKEGK